MTDPRLKREDFFRLTMKQMGAPYIWGAKGREVLNGRNKVKAFDCSGLVTWALWELSGKKWDQRQVMNTDRLWDYFAPTGEPKPGDMVLYGKPGQKADPNHVMLWVGFADMVYGASGGGSQTTTITPGAHVQVKTSHLYRPDFLGFRSLGRIFGDFP